jgi:hypothetical protein
MIRPIWLEQSIVKNKGVSNLNSDALFLKWDVRLFGWEIFPFRVSGIWSHKGYCLP